VKIRAYTTTPTEKRRGTLWCRLVEASSDNSEPRTLKVNRHLFGASPAPKASSDEPNSKRHSPAAVPHTQEHERNECLTMLPANPNNGEVRGNIRPILMLTGFVSR